VDCPVNGGAAPAGRGDLGLDRAEAGLLSELGLDALAGQSLELGRRIGGAAVRAVENAGPQVIGHKALQHRQQPGPVVSQH